MANGLNSVAKVQKLKTWALGVLSLAAVIWAVAMLILVFNYDDLSDKNEKLILIVEDLERRNGELDDRLQCRAEVRDELDRAIGRGLAAVAQDDPAELERQAQIMIALTQEDTIC